MDNCVIGPQMCQAGPILGPYFLNMGRPLIGGPGALEPMSGVEKKIISLAR